MKPQDIRKISKAEATTFGNLYHINIVLCVVLTVLQLNLPCTLLFIPTRPTLC